MLNPGNPPLDKTPEKLGQNPSYLTMVPKNQDTRTENSDVTQVDPLPANDSALVSSKSSHVDHRRTLGQERPYLTLKPRNQDRGTEGHTDSQVVGNDGSEHERRVLE